VNPSTLVSPFLSREEEESARRKRVHVSPLQTTMERLDTKSHGVVPSGSLRNRLVQARKSSLSNRDITPSEMEDLISTPPGLFATSPANPGLSQRSPNIPRNGAVSLESPSPLNPFRNWDIISSSDEELPDLAAEFLFKGKNKAGKETPKQTPRTTTRTILKATPRKAPTDSDDEYGLPSEFDTPRKKIIIEDFSDEIISDTEDEVVEIGTPRKRIIIQEISDDD
jgi:hypothetical protein